MPSSPPPPSPWNVANALTAARVVLVPLFGWLLMRDGGDDDLSRTAAFVVFAIAMMTDRADGQLARRRGIVTDVGKIADPIADKALMGMAFVGLSLLGELPWWVTTVVLAREIGITVLRFAVIRRGVIAASRGGKLKTVLQTIALALYILPLPETVWPLQAGAMALAVAVTLTSGIDYLVNAFRPRRAAE